MSDKLKVITTGPFMLIDPYTNTQIEPEVETEVRSSAFIRDRIELGHLKVVHHAAPKKVAAK